MTQSLFDIEKGFQTSVNIGYDLNNSQKVKSLIPTTEAINLAEDIFYSTNDQSTKRARFLIGAYGKGKSHMVLVILSMLCIKDKNAYDAFLEKVKHSNSTLYDYIEDYLKSKKKLLPVVIDGNSNTLTQSFLGALYKTLIRYGLTDIMPNTHFQAALHMIHLWQDAFPDTYQMLRKQLTQPISQFIERLKQFDVEAYRTFESLYPQLTAGSQFNPFAGFNVVDIYDSVNQQLAAKGYNGIYVVYDEFSKYLEANITSTSAGDVKMLQDFAEKCNRSGKQQLHLLMILHKEIENYIDQLPKQKVDGWRGVSERFAHIALHSDYSQVYEVIAHAIHKKPQLFSDFVKKYNDVFSGLDALCQNNLAFNECGTYERKAVVYGCYPLHPLTTFILPRLSEKVAQNERTLFTFISGDDYDTLPYLLEKNTADCPLITPDALFNYFAPQMKKAFYDSEVSDLYKMTARILADHSLTELEAKIVKTISLIYVLGQFNKLAPTVDTIVSSYQSTGYSADDVKNAISDLTKKQCILYLKRSNAYLRLKAHSGVKIFDEIKKMQEKRSGISTMKLLDEMNPFPYEYPNRYNDAYEMVRYFKVQFITGSMLFCLSTAPHIQNVADGMIYAVLPKDEEELLQIQAKISSISSQIQNAVFVVPQQFESITDMCREYDSVCVLRQQSVEDQALYDEYDVIYQDLSEVIGRFISSFCHPEMNKTVYYYAGIKQTLYRKSNLSELLSSICEKRFSETPIINNETLNKNQLTPMAMNSRAKLLNGLIQNFHMANLGLTGTGQEVSFLRSSLINTGVLKNVETTPQIDVETCDRRIAFMLHLIKRFFEKSIDTNGKSFQILYDVLTSARAGIGIRKGVLPIYLAVVIKRYKGHVVLFDQTGEVPFTADTLQKINRNPEKYRAQLETWNQEKEDYISSLKQLFSAYLPMTNSESSGYESLITAMNRWYLSLPKYAKEIHKSYVGNNQFEVIPKENRQFISQIKLIGTGAQKVLFEKFPHVFGETSYIEVFHRIRDAKKFYDTVENNLYDVLVNESKKRFLSRSIIHGTLDQVARGWLQSISEEAKEYLYANSAERLIQALQKETQNEYQMVDHLAKALTGVPVSDWNENTVLRFNQKFSDFIDTIQKYVPHTETVNADHSEKLNEVSNLYEIQFVGEGGKRTRKTFTKEAYSKRAKLLYNDIENSIEEMGQSITVQEKRQVLMDILTKLL